MCTAPGKLRTGQLIGCRKCWQCKERRVNDWVGRNIAESRTARASHFVTLTYGRDLTYGSVDHERAAVLTYSDVQKFFKRVRKTHKCRYFVVGEYGSKKGRAHWHVLIYWKNKRPQRKLDENIDDPWWTHGFALWRNCTPETIRYACKYIQKDIGEMEQQGHMSMSKKPPLGTEYFRGLAQQYVDQSLAPQDLIFGWRDVRDAKGQKVPFYMSATVARDFIDAYVELWGKTHGKKHAPWSELVEEYQDRKTRREANDDWLGRWDDPIMINTQELELSAKRNHAGFSTAWKDADGQPLIWQWDQEGNGKWTSGSASEKSDVRSAESAKRRKPQSRQQSLRLFG